LPERCVAVLPTEALGVREEFGIAEGGRFCDSSRCRGETGDVFGVFVGRPFIAGALCAGAFGVAVRWFTAPFAGRFAGLFTGALPTRPAVRTRGFTVRTGICDAPCAGVVRATTLRFWTGAGGLATFDFAFTNPSELCCVGLIPTELVTCAPRNEASVMWPAPAPRLIAPPFVKVLRFVVVTACTLCAFT
jgi:hypothetical protein